MSDNADQPLVANEALAAILESLGTAPSFRDCIRDSIFALHLWTQAMAASIFRLNPADETLEQIHSVGFTTATVEATKTIPVRGSLSGGAIRSGEVITVDNIAEDERIPELVRGEMLRQGGKRLLSLPLMMHGRAVGVLNMLWSEPIDISPDDARALMQIGYGLAIAVDHDQREYESTRDGLTGLYNRREFDFRLRQYVEASRRNGTPLSMAFMDVDNFKRCNDEHGHATGDLVLKQLARDVEACLGKGHSAFRYGGEEFAVISPRTELRSAAALAEAIRQRFRDNIFPAPHEIELRLTVSIGVAQYNSSAEESVPDFLERTDAAMYHAKCTGKDCVRFTGLDTK